MKKVQNLNMCTARSLAKKGALLVLVVVLAGCSALRLSYSNGETLSYWWLNTYVGFDQTQRAQVRTQLDNLFSWHRRTQLPDYAQLMGAGQRRLQDTATVTPEIVRSDYDGLKKRVVVMLDQALPALADLALSLSPEQIDRIENKLVDSTERYRNDYLTGDVEDRQQFRYKKVMKQAEYWFGDFSDAQESRIRRLSDARPLDNALVLADRIERRQALIALLKKIRREQAPRVAVVQALKDYTRVYYERTGNGVNMAFFAASTDAAISLTADVIAMTTPRQKAHAIRQLQDLQELFLDLAG
ncbi:putative lipoprotein [Oxalobacteraceae bacterium IMCC9480]|nr:putative lipoprotein [Oxalobacteraceae bacterium IMCC9480]